MPADLEDTAVAGWLGKFSFHSNRNKRQSIECANYCLTALISHIRKVLLKNPKARLQQNVNHELPDVQAGFRKVRKTWGQITNTRWVIKKAREPQKNIYSFLTMPKTCLCRSQQNILNSSKHGTTRVCHMPPDKSVCSSRSNSQKRKWNNRLVPSWERSFSRLYCQPPTSLLNLHEEFIIQNARLNETGFGIKFAGRNINNIRYADDTIHVAEHGKNYRASWGK